MKYTQYLGLLIGALYGCLLRFFFETTLEGDFFNIYSHTYISLSPILVSLIPIFFNSKDLYKSGKKLFLLPALSVYCFSLFAFYKQPQDFWIIFDDAFAYIFIAGLSGMFVGKLLVRYLLIKEEHRSQFLGILSGALYGIIFRLIGGMELFKDLFSIYSITFIWITPICISMIPIFFSSNELYKNKIRLFLIPFITVFVFCILAWSTNIEDILCLFIIGLPFFIVAGLSGLFIGLVIRDREIKKRFYSLLLLPLILNPIENIFPDTPQTFIVESKIIIDAKAKIIWENVIEVPEIKDHEYDYGFYNYIGVPRPIKSKLEQRSGIMYRIGYFTEDFVLVESISEYNENSFVNFKIHLDQSQLRNKPTDQHLLKSGHFKFENISYRLQPLSESKTEVILTCEYRIQSKMNDYANFWAGNIIEDFEMRLLKSLKYKIEGDK